MDYIIKQQAETRAELQRLTTMMEDLKACIVTMLTRPALESPFLDLDQAAAYCQLEKGTISNAIYRGELHKQPGSRKVILAKDDLDTYLTTRRKKR